MKKYILIIIMFSSIAISAHAKQQRSNFSPDNSAANRVIIEASDLTAANQSNIAKDIDVTARIRKELMKDESLSTYAKNVKIIVLKEGITLRGPVNTIAERNKIVNVAIGVAPQMKIYNKMTVVK